MRNRSLFFVLLALIALLLSGCGLPDPHDPDPSFWLRAVVFPLANALSGLSAFIESIGLPHSYGFAIVLFTIFVKIITFPLTLKQLQSMRAMQELQPQIQELQKKYGKDREKLAQAQMQLYREAGANPLGGCFPVLIQMPVLFGLYQALYVLSARNELTGEPFLWIPDLSIPGFYEGLGWISDAFGRGDIGYILAYSILPVLLIVSQFVLQKMSMTATPAGGDTQQAIMQQMMMIMPIMFGFFTLQVPAGLALYWVVSNILQLIQQYYIMGWGGLQPMMSRFGVSARQPLFASGTVSGNSTASASVGNPGSDAGDDAEVEEEEDDSTSGRKRRGRRRRRRK